MVELKPGSIIVPSPKMSYVWQEPMTLTPTLVYQGKVQSSESEINAKKDSSTGDS